MELNLRLEKRGKKKKAEGAPRVPSLSLAGCPGEKKGTRRPTFATHKKKKSQELGTCRGPILFFFLVHERPAGGGGKKQGAIVGLHLTRKGGPARGSLHLPGGAQAEEESFAEFS